MSYLAGKLAEVAQDQVVIRATIRSHESGFNIKILAFAIAGELVASTYQSISLTDEFSVANDMCVESVEAGLERIVRDHWWPNDGESPVRARASVSHPFGSDTHSIPLTDWRFIQALAVACAQLQQENLEEEAPSTREAITTLQARLNGFLLARNLDLAKAFMILGVMV